MSRNAKLYPTRIYRTQHDVTIENESNMYTGVDSDTYASVTNSTNYSDGLFLGGFDFSSIPTQAIVSSFSIKICLACPGSGIQSNGNQWLYNRKNIITTTNRSIIYVYSTPMVSTIDATPLTFEDLRSYGDDFNISVRTISGTTRVYGAEIDVEYDLPKNKVVYFGQTLIDLTADTVTAERLTKGFTAHDASGALITGTATEGSTYQDEDDCVVLGEDESSSPQGNISITANGTYDVAQYAGASVEVPVGMTKTELKGYLQGTNAFTDIDWPDGVTSIRNGAFWNCGYFNPSSLPSGLLSIGYHAFQYCTRLTLTSLPSSVQEIGEYAFYGCSSLALTSLPSKLNGTLGTYTFYSCRNIALTSLPSGVTSIGSSAFARCTSLALTSLPDGITSIGSSAFIDCANLALTSLPSGLTSIGNSVFVRCTSIESISCDGAITSLGSSAFQGCSSLTSASFPNMALTSTLSTVFGTTTATSACQQLAFCDIGSTNGIAANAFANCYALETLVLRKTASVCTLGGTSAFLNTPMRGYDGKTGKVYVPSALIESYKTATNWATLYDAGTVEFLAIEGSEYER